MRGIAGGVGFLVFAITATTWAAPVKNQDVTFPSGSEMIAGYLAEPESPGRHPAMLVLHAEWGLTDWVKERTRQLAEQGYVALAVDLYRGRVAYDPALAYELMIGTPPENAPPRHGSRTRFPGLARGREQGEDGVHRLVYGRKVVIVAGGE